MIARFPGCRHDAPGERRTNQRVPIRGRAVFKTKRGVLIAQTVDISAHGVCLTLPHALDVGSRCHFELEIHGEPTRRTATVGRMVTGMEAAVLLEDGCRHPCAPMYRC
jgi:hypothetical protein